MAPKVHIDVLQQVRECFLWACPELLPWWGKEDQSTQGIQRLLQIYMVVKITVTVSVIFLQIWSKEDKPTVRNLLLCKRGGGINFSPGNI